MPNRRGRVFLQIFYATLYIAVRRYKGTYVGQFFIFQFSQQIKVNGVTLDECIFDFSNLNVSNYVKRFEQVIQ